MVKNDEARLRSGNLDGSTLTINRAVKNMIERIGINIKELVCKKQG